MTQYSLDASRILYAFSPDDNPVLCVETGSTLVIETKDSYNNRFQQDQSIERYLGDRAIKPVNPVSGPIYIRDTQPGDGLTIRIDDIRLAETGFIAVVNGIGIMGSDITTPSLTRFHVRGDRIWLENKLSLPLRPNIGTIGVAPHDGEISSLELGRHGGNLDCNEVTTGTILHLPVAVPGGLLALGDVHARMGYGEVYSGVNIAATVTITVERVPAPGWKWPWLETENSIATIGVGASYEAAARVAVTEMTALLRHRYHLTLNDAIALTGAGCDLRPGQTSIFGTNVSVLAAFPLPEAIPD